MITVKNLSKKYGNHMAVNDLSFDIEEGKIIGFLGPNGAGKSTTMNMITGFLAPTQGSILINGIDIMERPEEAKALIGYLPEQPPLYMDMTVNEYLLFVSQLKKLKSKEIREQIEKVEEMTLLSDVKHRLIKNLSKGYRQRVGLAQALLGFPPVIILDEPMVGLDPKQIIEIRDLIKNLKENHTVLLSSHILSEISMVCDQIMIISHGNLLAYDTPENLSARSKKNTEIKLTIKTDSETLNNILSALDGLSYDISSGENPSESNAIITSPDPEIAEKIFYACADAHTAITSMIPHTESLEDIFLELTDNDSSTVEGTTNSIDPEHSVTEEKIEESEASTI